MGSKMQAIADFARGKIGCGYVYGATGWVCTEQRRQQQAAQYPQWKDNILNMCAKWDGKPCYDCAQLTRAAAKTAGATIPSGATSQWNADIWAQKGEIGTLDPTEAGLLLYRRKTDSATVMQHTGVAVGGGEAVDSRGSSAGVVLSPISSYGWTHWGRLKMPEREEQLAQRAQEKALYTRTVTAAKGSTVNLRAGASTTSRRVARLELDTAVEVLEECGDWLRVRCELGAGYIMTRYLTVDVQDWRKSLEERVSRLEAMLL